MSMASDGTLSPLKRAYLAIEQLEARKHAPVAIIGTGLRFPGGAVDQDSYWQLLAAGVDAISEIPSDRWDVDAYFDADPDSPGKVASRFGAFIDDVDKFDPLFFGISPREAERMDPQQRLLLETSWEALERACISADSLDGSLTGVFLGLTTNDYALIEREAFGVEGFDQYYASGFAHSIASGRLSYVMGLQGPSISIDTACSSSLVAIHLAVQSLRNGESNLALAGGVNLMLSVETSIALSRLRMLAPDGRCKAFDASADGFVRSEGCGVVVLKRLADALADNDPILAVIRGSAVNQDGRSNGLTAPNGPSQEAVLRAALADARLSPDSVDYIEAHGTGTALGDPIEAHALGAVFGQRTDTPLLVGSVKTNLGHLEAAAGIAGLLKVVLMLRHGQVPASLHFSHPSPHIAWERLPLEVPVALRAWPETAGSKVAGVSSFGFSGTNAHILLEAAPTIDRAAPVASRPAAVLPLSAHTSVALEELAARYAGHLTAHPELALADVAATLGAGRAHHAERLALVASDTREAAQMLAAIGAGDAPASVRRGRTGGEAPGVVFLFTGQGSQYAGMGQELYATAPVFREALDRCATLLADQLERPLLEVLFAAPDSPEAALLDETRYTQPALFALEYALAQLWQAWGVRPAAVAGHSLGEYVAACVAGALSLEDALALVAARGRLMGSLPAGGAMAAVFAPVAEVRSGIAASGERVAVAAVNGPSHTVISGTTEAVEAVSREYVERGVRVRALTVSHAFHSYLMEPVLDDLREILVASNLRAPNIRIFSNLTGAGITTEAADPDYWIEQTRNAVQFEASVDAMRRRHYDLFLEIGPHPVLSGMARDCTGGEDARWLPSLRRGRGDWQVILDTLGQLYIADVEIDWSAVSNDYATGRAPMPTYPFQHQRYWVQSTGRRSTTSRPLDMVHPLLGSRLRSALSEIQYELELGANDFDFLEDHQVFGRAILPAAAIIEAGLAAAGVDQPSLSDVVIQAPLAFSGDERRVLQTIVSPDGESAKLRFLSRGVDDDDWTLHVSASHVADAAAQAPASVDLAMLHTRCPDRVETQAHYERLNESGIQLGPALQAVRGLWHGEDEALAEIHLEEEQVEDYRIHPAMLDAAFQTLAATVPESAGAYIPIALERAQLVRRPGSSAWCHARLRQPFTSNGSGPRATLTADISLYDAGGGLLFEAVGLALKRADQSVAEPLDRMLYEVTWQSSAQPSPRPAPEILVGHAATVLEDAPERRDDLERYRALNVALDELCAGYIVAAFDQLGWRPQPGEEIVRSELAERLGVTGRNHRLLGRLLAIMVEEDYLSVDGDRYVVLRSWTIDEPAELEARRVELAVSNSDSRAELVLLGRCALRLSEILVGDADPLHLLFPDGDTTDAEALYADSLVARSFNQMVQTVVGEVRDAAPDRPLHILEIGGGTGGTTAHLLPHLPAEHTEYVFTDISPAFTARAAEKFKQYPFATFQPLDVERDPLDQGLSAGKHDIVLAVNVLHAVQDLRQALDHIRTLLAPGGLLLLVEVTAPYRWIDLTFGLTDGWWRFSDTALRPDYPLIDRELWIELLAGMGFEAAVVDLGDPESVQQALLVARAPMEPVVELPGTWLIYTDDSGVGTELASMLAERGGQPVIAQHGETYRRETDYTVLDPLNPDAFVRLMQESVPDATELAGIVYLWGLDTSAPGGPANIQRSQALAGGGPLHAVQAALAVDASAPVWLVTCGAQSTGVADVISPEQAPLWGLGKSIALEHPELRPRRIDLDPEDERPAHSLLRELSAADDEQEIALRGEKRLLARLSRMALSGDEITDEQPVELTIAAKGTLDGLALQPASRREPGPGEVEIRVRAAGLNFKDVMNLLGMYPGDPGPLGGECAGTIVRVGTGVTNVRSGDEVLALAGGSFRSYVTARAEFVVPRPARLSASSAATTAIAYVTASIALEQLGQLKAGERVLIHAAAGGVGMAAVHLALAAGADVFATAGSPEKHAFLRELGVEHIFSSRTLDFADEILAATDGEGVDLVLNSLSGDFVARSLALLRQGGRFLELGKRDHLEADEIAALNRGISYHIIDWSETAQDDPSYIASILQDVLGRVACESLPELPVESFPIEASADAFRYMARARHIGKVAITFPAATEARRIHGKGFYLITGGLSGLGLATAVRLAERGARYLALMARGEPSPETQKTIAALERDGVTVLIYRGDVAVSCDVQAMLERIDAANVPLVGIFHCAGVLDDAGLGQQTWERFRRAFAPKIDGAWLLHTLTEGRPIEHFVLFSSIAAVMGAPGQANHSAANAYLDALASYRRGQGLPGLSVNWGAWADIGAAADTVVAEHARQQGLNAIPPGVGLDALEALMASGSSRAVVASVSWPAFLKRFAETPPYYDELAAKVPTASSSVAPATRSASKVREALAEATPMRRREIMLDFVQAQAGAVLGVEAGLIAPLSSLSEYGLDSLMAVELRNRLGQELAVDRPLPATLVFDYPNVEAIADYLTLVVFGAGDEGIEANGAHVDAAHGDSEKLVTSLLDNLDGLSDDEIDLMLATRAGQRR